MQKIGSEFSLKAYFLFMKGKIDYAFLTASAFGASAATGAAAGATAAGAAGVVGAAAGVAGVTTCANFSKAFVAAC